MTDNEVVVETPFGKLVAKASPWTGEGYPGIVIELRRDDDPRNDEVLALVEATETEADLPDGPELIARVWGDEANDEYTDRVIYRGYPVLEGK